MEFLNPFKTSIQCLCLELYIKKLYVFGSVTSSRFGPESDIDFLVDIDDRDPLRYSNSYFELAEGLEKILGRKVDLVTINALKNPFFIHSVEASKTLFYAA